MEKQKSEKEKKNEKFEMSYNMLKRAGTKGKAALQELENIALKNKLSK